MKRRLFLAAVLAGFGCSELPTPPTPSAGGIYRDTIRFRDTMVVVWRDSVRGWVQDDHGIWRDGRTSNFDTSTAAWSYGPPFVDMPPAYRQFWRYCANCHSSLGTSSLAPEGRKAMTLNTWEQVLAFGPEKLVLAARGGGMPLRPAPPVPEDVIGRAQAYLASWSGGTSGILLVGYRWPEAENFVRKYCADCHTPGGGHPLQSQAMLYLILDTYTQWHKRQNGIKERIDTAMDPLFLMPPDTLGAHLQPSKEERRRMMEWIDRLSPNTPDGSGVGDSIRSGVIITEGAVKGLIYDTAFKLINRYCADCHTVGGLNKDQPDAWTYSMRLDTYGEWAGVPARIILERLDPVLAAQNQVTLMPPEHFPYQPTSGERQILLDWLNRGSPNTSDGR